MLTCITCSKQRIEDGEDAPRGASITKDAVKSLTSQIKDMASKVSGSSSKSKTDNFKIGQRPYPEFDTISERVPHPYLQGAGSSSTPAWDYNARTPRPGSPGFSSFGVDRTPRGLESISAQFGEITIHDEDEPREWIAQVEPGVQITFISLPRGGNDLKRIRFSREMFNKWQAQRWWGENFDRIMELYNVQKFHQQVMNTPGRSEDGRDSTYSRLGSTLGSPRVVPPPMTPRYSHHYNNSNYPGGSSGYPYPTGGGYPMSSMEASRTTTSSRDEASVSISNASEVEVEWIEEDQPGVFLTIRQFADGTRELRRVRFSREKFGEVDAKQWWETNRDRIQAQYLS